MNRCCGRGGVVPGLGRLVRPHGVAAELGRQSVAGTTRGERFAQAGSLSVVLEVITMPRSLQVILEHADELERRFADHEPNDVRDAAPLHAIRTAVTERAATERRVAETVATAREAGVSWSAIGSMLGNLRRSRPKAVQRTTRQVRPTASTQTPAQPGVPVRIRYDTVPPAPVGLPARSGRADRIRFLLGRSTLPS